MSKFCHYGCEIMGCIGISRDHLIDEIMDRDVLLKQEFLESLSDDELDQMSQDLTEGEPDLGHIKRSKK